MKKAWLVTAAVIIIFSSCSNSFLSAPIVPSLSSQDASNVPVNLSATHGEKRAITISWDSVDNAVLYHLYETVTPYDSFVQRAETTSNNYTFSVQPGRSVYYRVSSVSHDGTESTRSRYVLGTSLAQPIISDITDVLEDSASVTWYMENVSAATYRDDLLYIIYCFDGDIEVARIILEASAISENRAVFTGLNANTRYEYQVEAFLRSDQSENASEKSDKMDAATARRFRPGPPLNLTAAHGAAVDKVELTFELPDMVDIALGENTFDPKPLYFTVSKRLYSESGGNEYLLVCEYFGENPDNVPGKAGGTTFSAYMPGSRVTWVDRNIIRGVKYEYRVQSYVDNTNRPISSESSRATAVGWALGTGEVSYGRPEYVLNDEGTLYTSAILPIGFVFDHKEEIYTYTVVAKVDPIEDTDVNNPDASFTIRSQPLTYEGARNYVFKMNLTQKSTVTAPGRGIYSVEIEVRLPGGTAPIDTFYALGSMEISEDTQPIVVTNFHIHDGYTDRFVLVWDNHSNRRYIIQQSANGTAPWTVIGSVNDNPDDTDETFTESYEYIVSGEAPDTTKYFRIVPVRSIGAGEFKNGQPVYAPVARTMGRPQLTLDGGPSYSVIIPAWSEAQKADTYRVKYRYTDEGGGFTVAQVLKREELFLDALGRLMYPFRPEGYDNVAKSGREIQIVVEAINSQRDENVSLASEEDVRTRLVGPALLNASASKAVSTQDINVSWDRISGAGGYYVFRRQFNMTNTAEEGTESVVYYVPGSDSSAINVIGKDLTTDASNSRVDTDTVKATASFANSRYTLRDSYLTDLEYRGAYNRHALAYRNQQNNIVQGLSYRYFVVPVIVRNNISEPLTSIEFNYNRDGSNRNTSISSYTVQEDGFEIHYSGAAAIEQEGFAIGFGQNVTATKGTYSSGGSGLRTNDGIRITWSPPPRLSTVAGFTPRYTVYRRATGSSTWTTVRSVDDSAFVETPPDRGIAYEYAVGISNAGGGSTSQPHHSERFIELSTNRRDERNRPYMLGYMLGMVRMDSVSRSEMRDSQNNFAEEVRWHSAGIDDSKHYSSDNNNWGIDGYDIFVMNRNIDANWHRIADIANVPVYSSLSLRVSNERSGNTLQGGLLKVMRDYKHFFKVRSYVMDNGEKVYSPDPAWTYQYRFGTNQAAHIAASNNMENDYVKWGARQITANEFIRISTLYMARGLSRVNGTGWSTGFFGKSANASTSWGGSGSISADSNFGVTEWEFNFNNYKDDLQARCGQWMTFITVNGRTRARTGATNQYPQRYREQDANTWLDIIGPWDTPGLYAGRIKVGTGGDNASTNLHWGSGQISIQYPSGTSTQNFSWRGEDSPLPYTGRGDNRHEQDAWK